jgi:hypothetical protein
MAPANGVRVRWRTRAWAAGPAPAITILGRAAAVVDSVAAVEDDVVGDNAEADMCRPFRWGGPGQAGVLDEPQRRRPIFPGCFPGVATFALSVRQYLPAGNAVRHTVPKNRRQQSNAGSLGAHNWRWDGR